MSAAQIDDTKDQRVEFERIRMLFVSGVYGVVGVLITVLFVPLLLWNYTSHRLLLVWAGTVGLLTLGRLVLVLRFRSQIGSGLLNVDNVGVWETRFSILQIVSGICWAALPFFPFAEGSLIGLLLVTLVLVAMASSSVMINTTAFRLAIVYTSLTALPLTIKWFTIGGDVALVLGCMCVFFYLFVLRLARVVNRMVIHNIKLQLDNETLSLTDPLTGLANRRRLYLFMEKLLPNVERHGIPFCLIMFDIDRFKEYNDTHGHQAGDDVLQKVATLIQAELRKGDLVVRYGGEEFLVALPDSDPEQSHGVAERIRRSIKANTPVTISGGIADFTANPDFDQLVRAADQKLYQAKQAGRDRVVVESTPN